MTTYRDFERRNIYLPNYNAIYFYVPKVASTSFKKLCAELLDIQVSEKYHQVEYPSLTRKELALNPDYFKFAFVRNPFDRLVSCYVSKVVKQRDFASNQKWANTTFDEFVQLVSEIPVKDMDVHFQPQHMFLTDNDNNLLVDFLGRFENLQGDFERLCRYAGFPDTIELGHRAKSTRSEYSNYYSKYSRKLAEDIYNVDLNEFSYAF